MKIRIVTTDLWPEPEGGYSANGAYGEIHEIEVPDNATDRSIIRRIKATAGIQGWRKAHWCCADFGPWRSGSMGAYADLM